MSARTNRARSASTCSASMTAAPTTKSVSDRLEVSAAWRTKRIRFRGNPEGPPFLLAFRPYGQTYRQCTYRSTQGRSAPLPESLLSLDMKREPVSAHSVADTAGCRGREEDHAFARRRLRAPTAMERQDASGCRLPSWRLTNSGRGPLHDEDDVARDVDLSGLLEQIAREIGVLEPSAISSSELNCSGMCSGISVTFLRRLSIIAGGDQFCHPLAA